MPICGICSIEKAIFETRCGHFFHQRCIFSKVKRDPSCPCCGIQITSKLVFERNLRYFKGEEEALKGLKTPDLKELLLHFCDNKLENFEPIIAALVKRGWKLNHPVAMSGQTIMSMACEAEFLPMVSHLIKLGVDIDKMDDYSKRFPVQCAIEKGNLDLLNILIEYDVDLENKKFFDVFDGTLLSFACTHANLKIVERLLESNVKIDESHNKVPALHALAVNSQDNDKNLISIAKLLLSKGADVNTLDKKGFTALHFAAANRSAEFVEFLIEHGADVNATGKFGYTPLLAAALHCKELEVVKKLVEHGANIEAKGSDSGFDDFFKIFNRYGQIAGVDSFNVLHNACASGNLEVVNYLIDKGININSRIDYDGITGLHVALFANNYEIAMMLLDRGCRVDLRTPMNFTPLHSFCDSVKGISADLHLKVATRLLQSGCSVNARGGWYQETPLAMLCKGKPSIELLSFLVERGADISAGDYLDQTPLHHAVFDCNVKLVKMLIRLGADVKAKDSYGHQPIHQILIGYRNNNALVNYIINFFRSEKFKKKYPINYFKIMKMLKYAGADLNAQTNRGAAAIHYIKWTHDWDIVEKFVKFGADLFITDFKGRDIFLRAKKRRMVMDFKKGKYPNIRKSLKEREKLKNIQSNFDHQIYQFLCVDNENKI